MRSSGPIPATPGPPWPSRRSPTCCGSGICDTIPGTPTGSGVTVSCCRPGTPACCSTRCSTSPGTTSRSTTSSRSEEHTSELQSRLHLVCRLLLEKKKKKYDIQRHEHQRHKPHSPVTASRHDSRD